MPVFLCHSSGDKPAVRELCRRLAAEGHEPWLDEQRLLPGQDWQLEIPKAIHQSQAVVVCLSRASVSKEGYLQKEIKYALDVVDEKPEGTIFLIPVKLEECEVPGRLLRWQWANLYEQGGYERLALALGARALSLMTAEENGMPDEVMSGSERVKGVMHLDRAFEKWATPFIWTADLADSPERAWVVYFWNAVCKTEVLAYNAHVKAVRSL